MKNNLIEQKIKEIRAKHTTTADKNINLKILAEIAKLRGGKIKEGEVYINNSTKMIFVDSLGNEFKMTPNSIKGGYWSPYEAGNVRDSEHHIKQLEEIASSRDGKIKDGEIYINNSTKMIFLDSLGNEFKMTPAAVKSGQWSPYESGTVRDSDYHMKELEEIASSRGGKIKEGEIYINAKTKMIFIDSLGNEFEMPPSHIKRGSWSPYESGHVFNNPDYHIKQLEEIAHSRGGKIKEGEIYINANTKMLFIDQLGNEFEMLPSAVKTGNWSPYEKNYSEHICRQIIEQIYKKQFPSVWNIIKRKNGNKLQLDGYNSELKIAFEYQGMQHTTGWFHQNDRKQEKSLIQIQERDKEKKQICAENNILLLEIKYYKTTKNIQDIINQTVNDVKKSYEIANCVLPNYISDIKLENIKVDLSKISHLVLMQKELEDIVLKREGKIKEGEIYMNANTKITFIDKVGNEFEMTPSAVKAGQWSPYESGHVFNNPEYHMKELEEIASSRGGKIKEGETYINNQTKMTFIDKFENEFEMKPKSVKAGQWSPYVSGTVRDSDYHMKELEEIASSRGGKIKEGDTYINNQTKMTFIDQFGNEFKMKPSHIKSGSWSPYESGHVFNNPEYHMKKLEEIVLSKGGKIKEGEIYINAKTKMTFIDQFGNEFEMNPNNLKNGQWSPYKMNLSCNNDKKMNQ